MRGLGGEFSTLPSGMATFYFNDPLPAFGHLPPFRGQEKSQAVCLPLPPFRGKGIEGKGVRKKPLFLSSRYH